MFEMEDAGYVWNKSKYEEVRQKRGIRFYEVVSALENEVFLDVPHELHEDRFVIVAYTMTETKRLLVIVVSEEEQPINRIITAYDAEGRFLDEYKERYPE